MMLYVSATQDNFIKFADTLDVHSPDVLFCKPILRPMSFSNVRACAQILEDLGFTVCIEMGDLFYETEDK